MVTENIFKRIEQGMDPMTAAFVGTREIFFAVISTSLTLAIVFIPVIFLQGFTGRLFREFGIVVAGAVLISAFVSLTLTPVLNVTLGKYIKKHSRFYNITEHLFVKQDVFYRKALGFFIRKKWASYSILGICFLMIAVFGATLKSELAPLEDRSIIRTTLTSPEGTDFDYMDALTNRIGKVVIDSIPESRLVFARSGGLFGSVSSNTSGINIFLKDPSERKLSQQQIFDKLTRIYKNFPEARIFPNQEQTISTSLAAGSKSASP